MGLLVRDAGHPVAAVAASRGHLAKAMAQIQSGSRDLAPLRLRGLRRMQSRFREHGLAKLASELEGNPADLELQRADDLGEPP